jgi:mono/diheme cytochrome c family protein
MVLPDNGVPEDPMTARRAALVALVVPAVFALILAMPVPAAAEDAAKIFAKSCAPCHGKEGAPSAVFAKQGVRSFKDAAWQKSATDAQIEKSIREGKKGTMMASFEKQFSAEEIKALAAYIRKLGKQ